MQMLKNKKGASAGMTVLLILAALFVIGFFVVGFFAVSQSKQEALPETQAEVATAVSDATDKGKATTYDLKVYDNDGKAQRASTAYLEIEFNGVKQISSKATSATALTSMNTAKGQKVKRYAFDATYAPYYDMNTKSWGEGPVDIDGYKQDTINVATIGSGNLNYTYVDDDGTIDTQDTEGNLSIGTGTSGTMTLRIKNKNADTTKYLRELVLDTTNTTAVVNGVEATTKVVSSIWADSAGNSKAVPVIPLSTVGAIKPQALTNTADYVFRWAEVLPLSENTGYVDVDITFKKTSTQADEQWNVYVVDESCTQGVQPSTVNSIICGIQNDADTPADIGGANYNQTYAGITVK